MCAKFLGFLNCETYQRNFHFSLISVMLAFNPNIIMNILQKKMRILNKNHRNEIILSVYFINRSKSRQNLWWKKGRCTTEHKLIWLLTYFHALSRTDEGAIFHNLKLNTTFNIQFIYRKSVKHYYSIRKIYGCIKEK